MTEGPEGFVVFDVEGEEGEEKRGRQSDNRLPFRLSASLLSDRKSLTGRRVNTSPLSVSVKCRVCVSLPTVCQMSVWALNAAQ